MPWIAPNVGLITNRGYMYCSGCAATLEVEGRPVRGDAANPKYDICDRCKTPLPFIRTKDYIHVEK